MALMPRTKLLLICIFFAVAVAIDVGGTCANGGSCAKDGTTQTSQPSAEVPVVDTFGLIQGTLTLAQKIGVNLSVTPADLPKNTAQNKDSPAAAKERVSDVLKKVAMPFNMHRFMELGISAHEMREMLGANFTPETFVIIEDVIDTLAKHLEDNVKRDQTSANQEVVTRIGDLTEKTNSAVAQKTEADSADIFHSTCVTEEVHLLTAHKTCTDEETTLKEEKPSLGFCGNSILQPVDYPNSPDLIELLAKNISIDYSDDIAVINSQLDAHAAEVKSKVDTWLAAQKLIAETKKGEWTTANQKCIDKTKELADKTAECLEKLAAWQVQHDNCLHAKSAQQLAVCTFGYEYQSKCGSKTEYDDTRAGITGTGTVLSEPDREQEWTHFTRMMCVLETFKTTIELDSSAVDACAIDDDKAAADFTAGVGGRIDLQEEVYGELTSEAKFTCAETNITFGNGDLWTVPENTNDVALWPQDGADNRKCGRLPGGGLMVADQHACQVEAVAAGHAFYAYDGSRTICNTYVSCDSPVKTGNSWKIFKKPQAWLPTADEYTKGTGYAYAIKVAVSNPPFEFCRGSADDRPTCQTFDCSAGWGSAKPPSTPCHLDTGCTSADCCEDMFNPVVPTLKNNGFETGSTTPTFEYVTEVPNWSVGSQHPLVIIKSGDSAWGATTASEGDYFLGLQSTGSLIEQVLQGHKVGESYQLDLDVAKRSGYPNPTLKVIIDGLESESVVPAGITFSPVKVRYTASGSSVTIRFENGSPSGDRTAFIDNVRISQA